MREYWLEIYLITHVCSRLQDFVLGIIAIQYLTYHRIHYTLLIIITRIIIRTQHSRVYNATIFIPWSVVYS